MKRTAAIFYLVTISFIHVHAQVTGTPEVTDVTKITFLNPGFSYEKRIAKYQTLYGQAFFNTSAFLGYSSSLGFSSGISFNPAFAMQYRYYYNAAKRANKGKRTDMNSLNYLGGISETVFSKAAISNSHFSENNRRPIQNFGAVWGFQRNYKKRFSLDLNLGIGLLFTKITYPDVNGNTIRSNESRFTQIGQLNLGFWLNKQKQTE